MQPSPSPSTGILELFNRDGRVRILEGTLGADPGDPVLPAQLVDRYRLRPGVQVEVELGRPVGGNGNQQPNQDHLLHHQRRHHQKKVKMKHRVNPIGPNARAVREVIKIEGLAPEEYQKTRRFEDLTTIDPNPRITLEYPGCPPDCRLIDLFCPIGFGQRAMITSPPKAGKTTLLKNIANAIRKNHPAVEVIALLIDERPEEVTDFRRNVPCKVWASSNDHPPERHVFLSMLAIERAKRLAERGVDVVVLLDSLTRVGRAFNTAPGLVNTGRTLSGGLDSGALAIPKQLFGAARKFEEGGSLTIIATALVDTGSRGDQVIFEEFKGTGNMELILDRKIAERRLFPAIDLAASGTRKEHLLLTPPELQTMTALRRRLLAMQPPVQIEQLLKALERFKTNAELVGNPQSPARD
jgi:transcription termination factor Rho